MQYVFKVTEVRDSSKSVEQGDYFDRIEIENLARSKKWNLIELNHGSNDLMLADGDSPRVKLSPDLIETAYRVAESLPGKLKLR